MIIGQVLSGNFGRILIRQKAGRTIEIGELIIADTKQGKMLMQVYDLLYGSQLSQQNLELVSGLKLEEDNSLELFEKEMRNYTIAVAKNLISLNGPDAKISKSLPDFFSEVREIEKDDVKFLTKPQYPLSIGKLRSGSRMLDIDIFLEGDKALSHHILIPAMTGKGKSNFTSCMLWNIAHQDYAGVLVLDPHDEYFGRSRKGLKDHPRKEKIAYYTSADVPPGQSKLKIHLRSIKPRHFAGIVDWSDAQKEALNAYYSAYHESWIEAILLGKELTVDFSPVTIGVVKRRLLSILDIQIKEGELICRSVFDMQAGQHTIRDIVKHLEQARIVIIDTSHFSGDVEILIGSLVASEIFSKYKHAKTEGTLHEKPVISIILEEAPRVLGKDVLEKGPNIFSTIAREGRKFKIGLIAVTQLPSLIPKEILANMNTKIILGIEMQLERNAVIESASQDLSDDSRAIASLDTGEAIISSSFTKFAIPVKIPLFDELAKNEKTKTLATFSGMKLGNN